MTNPLEPTFSEDLLQDLEDRREYKKYFSTSSELDFFLRLPLSTEARSYYLQQVIQSHLDDEKSNTDECKGDITTN